MFRTPDARLKARICGEMVRNVAISDIIVRRDERTVCG
jgi:hypothetical protein